MVFASKPAMCIWGKRWLEAALWVFFTVGLLMLDDNFVWDAVIHLVLNLIVCMGIALFRSTVGTLTPSQIEDILGPQVAQYVFGKKVIRVREGDFLATSIAEVNKLKTEDM